MKRKFYFLAAAVLLAVGTAIALAPGVTPQEEFANANRFFEKGDLASATESYQTLIRQGFEGTALYYNLGNLHYRKGERGRAILWYERARRLSPRDGDIDFNLSLARSHIKNEEPNPFAKLLWYLTPSELGWALTVSGWVFFGLLGCAVIGWISKEGWVRVALWLSGILMVLSGSWYAGLTYAENRPDAIVISPPGEVRNGPGADYAVGFTVPEGSQVTILNQRPEWVQVGVPQQGLKGWMPAAEVERITASSLN